MIGSVRMSSPPGRRSGLLGIVFTAALTLAAASPAAAAEAPALATSAAVVAERAGCRECHNPEGVASDTRFVMLEAGSSTEAAKQATAALLELVDRRRPGESRLLRKPTKRVMHEGGQKIVPGSAEERTWIAWVTALAAAAPGRAPELATRLLMPDPHATATERGGFRRLTSSQYDNTVRDLLGDVTRPGRDLPPEDFVDGFRNQYQAQSVSPALAEGWASAAQRLAADAAEAVRLGDPRKLLPCRLARAGQDRACQRRFVQELGRRAFRRPLDEAEVRRFVALFGRERQPAEGLRLVIEAMLRSPSFLYLTDGGPSPSSRVWGRASRLSYFLWNTMPDDALLAAAAAGTLDTVEGLRRVVTRMIDDPRARVGFGQFIGEWLRTDRVRTTFKDKRQFARFTPETAAAMAEETEHFALALAFGAGSTDRGGDFRELVTARYTYANAELATLYGLPTPPGDGIARVPYPDSVDRAGILGHGSFLAGTSKPTDTSPTARGLFVREHLLCQKVPTPPPGVNMNLPPIVADKPQTNRERLAIHLSEESCARCHNLVDSIGYGFEKLDAIGAHQEKLKILPLQEKGAPEPAEPVKAVELPIDTRGSVAGLKDATFSSVRELGEILAKSELCQQCMVKQLFRYATGRKEAPQDRAVIERAFAAFKASGFRMRALLEAIAVFTEFPAEAGRRSDT